MRRGARGHARARRQPRRARRRKRPHRRGQRERHRHRRARQTKERARGRSVRGRRSAGGQLSIHEKEKPRDIDRHFGRGILERPIDQQSPSPTRRQLRHADGHKSLDELGTSWGRVGAWRQGLASGGRGQQGRKRTCSSSSNTCSAYTFSSTCNHEPKIGTTPALDDMALLRRRFTGGAEHGSLPVALCPSQGPGVRLLALLMGSRREARVWRRRHGLQRRLLLLIVPAAWADPAE